MTSLLVGLDIARQALHAQQFGLDVTGNNIANVNTPGYSRERVVMTPGEPLAQWDYQVGAGVRVTAIESYRQRFLDYRVNEEISPQNQLSAAATALQQAEALFNENTGTGLQSALNAFFNSFSSLANAPEDASLRHEVLSRGEELAVRFGQLYEQLQSIQRFQDRGVVDTANEINSITADLAKINNEVISVRGTTGNEGSLRDQRQLLLDRLAALVDISYYEDESGSLMVTSRQGALLVAGDQANPWSTSISSATNLLEVHAGTRDITSVIQSGKLGGLLTARDQEIASYLAQLDDLAAGIISKVNTQHALGSDLNGNAGGDFFVPFVQTIPGSNYGAAHSMAVAITDTDEVAAAETGAGVGSNANAKLLADIQNQPLLAGNSASLNQLYSNLVFRIGLDSKAALDGLETQQQLLRQVENQRDAATGVNLDDEAVNLLRFQRAYQANARFISVIDGLIGDLFQILGG